MFPVKISLTQEVQTFVSALLQRDPSLRLGSIGGADDFKELEFFSCTNWDKIFSKEEFPPFIPILDPENDYDTRNFDKEFTGLRAKESIAEDDGGTLTNRKSSTPQNDNSVVDFIGFSFCTWR